ncbi:CDP-alcohol phosphatidyltransferase family protein [Streptosporangium sp. NBC_01755]|uniref:CDP-alcohol phosphatidyltransferase family protein n=1 Tax=Streptosporangium sp. NBC_01755 TaxID=2975949 RepID=UPI002DDBD5F3|nr:CDP-alcohol phosphatidyltransferase family protein [Streptosporangium sp. NBC_01755]WSC97566.1 CDP-alcohol phosphatidyltransferase family protein [Streptosporangium sp. NBC_01755]
MRAYSLDDVHATRKRKDSWWTVFLVDPVACRLTLLIANHTSITPNGLTRFSLILGMCSAICFASGRLVAGALLFYVSFMVDCMDGKIARLKGTGTAFGLWLDYVGDRIRVVCCAAGLASGQYAVTGDIAYILLGAGVAVLDLFRYVNAPQMKRVREVVKENRLGSLTAVESVVAAGHARPAEAVVAAGHAGHVRPVEVVTPREAVMPREVITPREPMRVVAFEDRRPRPRGGRRPKLPRRFGRLLARHRVRTHLISGIEFHAAVFVVAPLVGRGALVPLAVASGALLLLNEVFLIYRMWLFSRVVPAAPLVEKVPRVSV